MSVRHINSSLSTHHFMGFGPRRSLKRALFLRAIAEAASQGPGRLPRASQCGSTVRSRLTGVGDRHAVHLRRIEADHLPELTLVNQPHRVRAELRGQHAIEGRRRTAPLQMVRALRSAFRGAAAIGSRRPRCCRCRPAAPAAIRAAVRRSRGRRREAAAPSATTTSVNFLPWVSRSRILWQTCSKVQGISGIRITSPPRQCPHTVRSSRHGGPSLPRP